MIRAFVSAAALAAALGTVVVGCEAKVKHPTGPGTVQLHVHGLKEPGDVEKLQKALEGVDGVTKVKIDKDGYTAIAVADQSVTTPAKLEKAVAEAGYSGHTGGH